MQLPRNKIISYEGGCILQMKKSIDKMVLFRQFGHMGDNYLKYWYNGKVLNYMLQQDFACSKINNIIREGKYQKSMILN